MIKLDTTLISNNTNPFMGMDTGDCAHVHNCSEDLIREFHDKVDWDLVSMYQKLSDDLIMEFSDKVNWKYIIKYQVLSEDTINTCINYLQEIEFSVMWEYQKLSEEFIRNIENTYPYRIYWNVVSKYQKLSEEFIREFQNKVYWFDIAIYQNLSEDFLIEFKEDVKYDIQYNKHTKYHSIRMIKEFKPVLNDHYKYNFAANKIIEGWLKYYYKPGNHGYIKQIDKFKEEFI